MEVHAHAHTPRKTWTHYFWEFLMLFLAVFCGFFAEYKLEQTIETHRAKEFALSLYSDLVADTAEFSQTSNALAYCANKIDTLVDLLNNQDELKKNTPAIYFTSLYAFIFPVNGPNESTMQQLLSSGSLRYFKSKEMMENIKKYNIDIQFVKEFANVSDNLNLEFRKIQLQIIELAPIVNYLNSGNLEYDSISYKEKAVYFRDSKLLTESNNLLKEYANWCNLKKFYFQNTISDYAAIKSDAKTVLNMIKKEYHLE